MRVLRILTHLSGPGQGTTCAARRCASGRSADLQRVAGDDLAACSEHPPFRRDRRRTPTTDSCTAARSRIEKSGHSDVRRAKRPVAPVGNQSLLLLAVVNLEFHDSFFNCCLGIRRFHEANDGSRGGFKAANPPNVNALLRIVSHGGSLGVLLLLSSGALLHALVL